MTETSSPLRYPLPSGIRLTGKTKDVADQTLHQIEATHPYPRVGGFISPHTRLAGNAWVEEGAEARGATVLSGCAHLLEGGVAIDSTLGDYGSVSHATVCGVTVAGAGRISGGLDGGSLEVSDSFLGGNALVYGQGLVVGVDLTNGDLVGRSGEPLLVGSGNDVIVVSPVGSEGVDATLVRTSGARGYHLGVGCWHGPIGDLMGVAQARSAYWGATEAEASLWLAQYENLVPLLSSIAGHWAAERETQEAAESDTI